MTENLKLVNATQENRKATPHWVEMKQFASDYSSKWGLELSVIEESFLVAQQIAKQPHFTKIIARVKPWVKKGLSMEERVGCIARDLQMSVIPHRTFGDIGFRTEINEKISKKKKK
jgi:hypothetical protein